MAEPEHTDPATPAPSTSTTTPAIDPFLSLDLRLRFLESLIRGPSTLTSKAGQGIDVDLGGVSIARRADEVVRRLKIAVEGGGSDAVRRFIEGYDLNSPLLQPQITAPQGSPLPQQQPSDSSLLLTPQAKVALILESEHDIKSLERDLREVESLEKRGVVGAGNLSAHEPLRPELEALKDSVPPLSASHAQLERRVGQLLQRYNEYINTVSEIFISWNSIVTAAEDEVSQKEKQKKLDAEFM